MSVQPQHSRLWIFLLSGAVVAVIAVGAVMWAPDQIIGWRAEQSLIQQRLFNLEARLDSVEGVAAAQHETCDSVRAQLDAVQTRLDSVASLPLETRLGSVETRLDAVETARDSVEAAINDATHERRLIQNLGLKHQCLSAHATDRNVLEVQRCDSKSESQRFFWRNGRLHSELKSPSSASCLSTVNDQDWQLTSSHCPDTRASQWVWDNHRLKHVASGKCLEAKGSTPGSKVKLATCKDKAGQKWQGSQLG